jgi:acetyl esterase/lipase
MKVNFSNIGLLAIILSKYFHMTTSIRKLLLLILMLACYSNAVFCQTIKGPLELTYKQVDTVKLGLKIFYPPAYKKGDRHPTIVFFFGGGWTGGSMTQFEPHALHYAAKNMVAVLVDYRVKSRHNTSPFESLKDAKSAIRYLRQHAESLGVDANRIVASGGSAGGHLAAACFTNESLNESSDDLAISAKPNALVLFNPVIDNGKDGYGFERIGENYVTFSPIHNIKKGFPPTIFFLGTKDKLIPVATAEMFKKKIEQVGGRCELFLYDDQPHGFFNKEPYLSETIAKTDLFLLSLRYIQ